jgi:hypothetical protein
MRTASLLLLLLCLNVRAQVFHLQPGDRLDHVRRPFATGDVNNDKVADTAIAIFDQIITADSITENDCGQGVCDLKLEFKSPIKPLVFEAMNVYLHPVMDVNGDGANEIAVYQWWYQCCWVTLNIYSYIGSEWNIVATSKAFISWDDDDFINRVVKLKGNYYLMGQKWNKDSSEIIPDKVKIKNK